MSPLLAQTDRYVQTNLVSDVFGLAAHTDPNLVNAWGITASATSPWWVNSAGKGLSLVYDSTGNPFPTANPIRVTIPPSGGSVPTGIVFNGTSDFALAPGQVAAFLFASATGTISGWNSTTNPTTAVIKATTPGAAYTGLTLGVNGGANLLYAANFAAATVDVFDGSFNPVSLGSGAFHDPSIPAGYAPFNVQNVGGSIYVMFAKQGPGGDSQNGPGLGFVDQFTPSGTLVRALQTGTWMNAPWGIVMAPATGFGSLSGLLLVGQFGSGQIATFDPASGTFKGLMQGIGGTPVQIDGLWGIRFGNGATAGAVNELYFAAGINDENDGLFGKLTVMPALSTPSTIILAPGQTTNLAIALMQPAGPAGVTINLTSSNPAVATVAPTATIFGGATSPDRRGPLVTALTYGQTTLTLTAPGLPTMTVTVQVTAQMTFVPSSITLSRNGTQGRPLLTLSSPAPAAGLTVTLTSGNPAVASVPTAVTFAAGTQTVPVPVTPLSAGSTTVRASAAPLTDAILNVTVQ